jgi:hypothetical protein
MTYQHDPNRRDPMDYLNHDNGGYAAPLAISAAFLIIFGLLIFGDWGKGPERPTTSTAESTAPKAPN